MIQADRVLSTPPTNTPVDTSRRRFLAVAAFASAAGAGSLAAAALASNDIPQAVTVPPAAAIAGHDPVFGLIEAHRKAHAAHMASLELQNRFERRYGAGHGNWISEKPCHDENEAFDAFITVPAITLPGLLAKLDYMEELSSEFETEWMIEERPCPGVLFRSFADSIANVRAVLS